MFLSEFQKQYVLHGGSKVCIKRYYAYLLGVMRVSLNSSQQSSWTIELHKKLQTNCITQSLKFTCDIE